MRNEIAICAGPRTWADTREAWLAKVPKAVKEALGTTTETVTVRMVKALWYGEPHVSKPEHHASRDIRRAAAIIATRAEAAALAAKYENLVMGMRANDPKLYSAEIDRLERLASRLRGHGRPGNIHS